MEITLGALSAIPLGEGRAFAVGKRRIAVFHTRKGQVLAVQADCPHRGGPLADGLVGGNTLICPLHSWKFDLESGKAETGDCSLETYATRLNRAGQIVVEVRSLDG
ncbi:MAG: Rieske 2Fe-2S domain-containing protein [Deltaproteobacteria bacterium]